VIVLESSVTGANTELDLTLAASIRRVAAVIGTLRYANRKTTHRETDFNEVAM
jgi:hypothetical protein